MPHSHRTGLLALVLTAMLAGAAAPPASASPGFTVLPGYDLFTTVEGTRLAVDVGAGVTLMSFATAPLRRFDFGAGAIDVAGTDTIVRRSGTATPGHGRVPIQIVALQMTSVSPAGYFVTLQTDRGRNPLDPPDGVPSLGTLDIRFDPDGLGGTFDTRFLVSYDVRQGSLDGPIVYSGSGLLQGTDRWSHGQIVDPVTICHAGPLLHDHCVVIGGGPIDGVNNLLNGVDDAADFNVG